MYSSHTLSFFYYFLVVTASWRKPALASGLTLFGLLGILISLRIWYRRSKRLKEVEQGRVKDPETGQKENHCKEQEQREYNEKELEYNGVVIEESSETKITTEAGDGKVTYKQTIVTCHL